MAQVKHPSWHFFQYPLRAYGVWNSFTTNKRGRWSAFQYPLRAYGVWNTTAAGTDGRLPAFQYPLRAYGVWNCGSGKSRRRQRQLSVPSAGLWGVERITAPSVPPLIVTFSTLCGPMGCGTDHPPLQSRRQHHFQYPLRAYGVWNFARLNKPAATINFQYPLRAYGVWNPPGRTA